MNNDSTNQTSTTPTKNDDQAHNNIWVLEIVFVLVLGGLIIAAFIEALSYELVSSRTPFVIMVPMLFLLGIQLIKLLRAGDMSTVSERVQSAFAGRLPAFSKICRLMRWLTALLGTIIVAGHYVGIAAFIFALTRILSREKLRISLITTAVTTAIIFVGFEYGFKIELFRGLIYRYFAGFKIF